MRACVCGESGSTSRGRVWRCGWKAEPIRERVLKSICRRRSQPGPAIPGPQTAHAAGRGPRQAAGRADACRRGREQARTGGPKPTRAPRRACAGGLKLMTRAASRSGRSAGAYRSLARQMTGRPRGPPLRLPPLPPACIRARERRVGGREGARAVGARAEGLLAAPRHPRRAQAQGRGGAGPSAVGRRWGSPPRLTPAAAAAAAAIAAAPGPACDEFDQGGNRAVALRAARRAVDL